jgi:hypothetical protein
MNYHQIKRIFDASRDQWSANREEIDILRQKNLNIVREKIDLVSQMQKICKGKKVRFTEVKMLAPVHGSFDKLIDEIVIRVKKVQPFSIPLFVGKFNILQSLHLDFQMNPDLEIASTVYLVQGDGIDGKFKDKNVVIAYFVYSSFEFIDGVAEAVREGAEILQQSGLSQRLREESKTD